jgi:preprotein translocase subunit YajC
MFATMAYYSSKIAASAYMDKATPYIRLLYIRGTHMISLLVRTSFVAIAIGAPAAYAQDAGAAGGAGAALGSFLPLILIFAIMYFLLIRPQQKKVKELKSMIEALRKGDQVLTQGGIIGKIHRVGDDGVLDLEIAEGVKVKVMKHTIVQVMNKTEPAAAA